MKLNINFRLLLLVLFVLGAAVLGGFGFAIDADTRQMVIAALIGGALAAGGGAVLPKDPPDAGDGE